MRRRYQPAPHAFGPLDGLFGFQALTASRQFYKAIPGMNASSRVDGGAIGLILLTVTVWGMNWIIMKTLTRYAGPFDVVFWRYALAFVVLFGMALARGRFPVMPPLLPSLGVAVFQTAGMQCLAQLALMSGGTGQIVMLTYTMPFWVVFFAWLILGDTPTRLHMVGFVLAALGLVCVMDPLNSPPSSLLASVIGVAAGASWGLGVVLSKRMFQRGNVGVMDMTVWQMFLAVILTLPFVLLVPQRPIEFAPAFWWSMAYNGLVACALGWWLWLSVVRRVSASVAGMASLGVPVLTVLFAWLILNELPTLMQYVGIACIMGGLVVVSWPGQRRAA